MGRRHRNAYVLIYNLSVAYGYQLVEVLRELVNRGDASGIRVPRMRNLAQLAEKECARSCGTQKVAVREPKDQYRLAALHKCVEAAKGAAAGGVGGCRWNELLLDVD